MMTTKSGADMELPENPEARRAKIKDHFPVEVRCPECSDVAFFYRSLPVRGRQFDAIDAMYPDGGRPVHMHPETVCGSCHETVTSSRLHWRGKSW